MMHWLHFRQLREVKDLTLDQQVRLYNEYVDQLQYNMYAAWLNRGGAGQTGVIGPVSEGFLQQEDLFYILQEDGSKIYVTI
jgi:hypothetical protein